jgi:hypothetical protein
MRGLIIGLLALTTSLGAAGGYKLNSISATTLASTSHTAAVISLNAIAVNGTKPIAVFLSALGPATGFYWRYTSVTHTAPTNGFHYQATSQTPILIDNLDKYGAIWIKAASATTGCDIVVDVCEQNSPGY